VIAWADRDGVSADLLINATPVGMTPSPGESPMPEGALPQFAVVADVVASPPETRLLAAAKRHGCVTVSGLVIAFHQAVAQFRHYTQREPPVAAMRIAAEQFAGVASL
jgi:shikimate 5-dehydrogenase